MEKPDGRSNCTFQPFIGADVPLVTVTLPSKPVPQSETLVNVAVGPAAEEVVVRPVCWVACAGAVSPSARVARATAITRDFTLSSLSWRTVRLAPGGWERKPHGTARGGG